MVVPQGPPEMAGGPSGSSKNEPVTPQNEPGTPQNDPEMPENPAKVPLSPVDEPKLDEIVAAAGPCGDSKVALSDP